jgi:hypothetical protein
MSTETENIEQVDVDAPAVAQTTTSPEDTAAAIRKAQGTAYGHIDAVLQEMGYKKPDGVKTSDFVKNTLETLTKAQKEALKTATDPAQPNEWEIKAKEYQKQLQTAEEERKNIEKSFYQKQSDMMLDTTISSLNLPTPPMEDEYKEDWLSTQKMAVKARFNNDFNSVVIDGKIVYVNKKTGDHVMGSDGDFAKPAEIIKNSYKSFFIDYSQYNKPTGVRASDSTNKNGTAKFKSTSEVHTHLKEKGLTFADAAYFTEYNKMVAESGIKV